MNVLQTIIKAAKAITRVGRVINRITGGGTKRKKKKAAARNNEESAE